MLPGQPRHRIAVLSQHILLPLQGDCNASLQQELEPSAVTSAPSKALDGVQVVELATVIAGPMAAAILGDMGATVFKVEPPDGDTFRVGGGPTFELCNHGKKGVVLDLKQKAGQEAFRGLLGTADVFVTNVRRKALESLNIDYEQLKRAFPRLVYAHVTGWGRSDTPNTGTVEAENEAAFDVGSFFARSGMMEAYRQGLEVPSAVQWPGAIGDMTTALAISHGITTALYHRTKTGLGQLVESSLLHTGMFTMGMQLTGASLGLDTVASIGWIPTRKPYQTKDGIWLQMLGSVPAHVHLPRLLRALDLAQLVPPREMWFPPHPGAAELVAAIRQRFAELESHELQARFAKHDVWHTVVNTPEMVLRDQRALDLNCLYHAEGVAADQLQMVRAPLNLSHSPFSAPCRAPHLGEHTHEVLQGILHWEAAQVKQAMGSAADKLKSSET